MFFGLIGREVKGTGLIPQAVDSKDYAYQLRGASRPSVDLRAEFSPVSDQGSYNSCTAHAVSALMTYFLATQKHYRTWKDFKFSEAYQWYFSRLRLGKQDENSGALLRDCFKVIRKEGFVSKSDWDFKDGAYTYPGKAKIAAGFYKLYLAHLPNYYALSSNEDVKNALTNGLPVVFGFPINDKFMRLNTANYVVKDVDNKKYYHAMIVVGYGDEGFIIRNSWGNRWGNRGHCIIPFSLFEKHSFDKWTLM